MFSLLPLCLKEAVIDEYVRRPAQTSCEHAREVPVEMAQAYEDQKEAICRWEPGLCDIVKML